MDRPIVLVVDDDNGIRESLSEMLAEDGYSVASVADGSQALSWLRHRTQPIPVVVLLDMMMPVMDGKDFLHEKARDPNMSDVPVIIITASGHCARLRHVFDVHDCLPKPFSIPRLMSAIEAAA